MKSKGTRTITLSLSNLAAALEPFLHQTKLLSPKEEIDTLFVVDYDNTTKTIDLAICPQSRPREIKLRKKGVEEQRDNGKELR